MFGVPRPHALTLAAISALFGFSFPAQAAHEWVRLRSTDFEFYTDASPRVARDTLRQFEQVRGFFEQISMAKSTADPVRVVAFASKKEFEPYKLNEFATAYYQSLPDRDYIVMSEIGPETFPIAVHEFVHLLARHAGLDLPPWLNEGIAELYSTLHQAGDQVIIGEIIPGRYQPLLNEKWVPLSIIISADQKSPYYNEKKQAGSLYNEGWALTHMLFFRPEYRARLDAFLTALAKGEDSIGAFQRIYGKTPAELDKDLQAYLRSNSMKVGAYPAKIAKSTGEVVAEPLSEFDKGLIFADLLDRPERENARKAALLKLVDQEPRRPEPYAGLPYLAYQAGRIGEALDLFGKAYERGEKNAKLLWDYGRLLESHPSPQTVAILDELVTQLPEKNDYRIELAQAKLMTNDPKGALETLKPIRTLAPNESGRYFRVTVYADLQLNEPEKAQAAAEHFQDIAKTHGEQLEAKELTDRTARYAGSGAVRQAVTSQTVETIMTNRPSFQHVAGRFIELDCRGEKPQMLIETDSGKQAFLLDNPKNVTMESSGPMDMMYGPLKAKPQVDVGFDRPASIPAGVRGIVRTLSF